MRRLARVERLGDVLAEKDGEVSLRILEKHHGFPADEVERLAIEYPKRFTIITKQNPKGGPGSRVLQGGSGGFVPE